jgi:hypothetical protein
MVGERSGAFDFVEFSGDQRPPMRRSADVILNRIESQSFPATDFLDQAGDLEIDIELEDRTEPKSGVDIDVTHTISIEGTWAVEAEITMYGPSVCWRRNL